MAIQEIPLTADNQQFSIILAGITWRISIIWRDLYWIMDLQNDRGEPVISGIPLVTGADLLAQYTPLSPPLYPEGELTDEPEATLIAELVREAALEGAREELPHSIAVTGEEMQFREGRPADNPLLDVHVNLFVERESQKYIIIGKGGSNLRKIGTKAREQIEAMLGTRIYLNIHVKVAKEWQSDARALNRLGF